MKDKKAPNTFHRALFFIVLSVFCLLSFAGCRSSSSSSGYRAYSGSVSVSVGIGKEGVLVEENPFPVTVHIDGDYASKGSFCVLTVPTNTSDYYAYRLPLSQDESQTLQFIVPASKYSSQLTIELLDGDENVIYSRTCTYQAYDEWQSMVLAGQMGTQTDTVAWPDQITRSDFGTSVSVRQITLTEDNLYTQKEGYQMLDFLSVDVSYFDKLASDVQTALLEWVRSGGTLIFQGSGGWSMLERMGVTGFGSSKNFSVGGTGKLLYRTFGKGTVWFLGSTLSQTVARLTDSKKAQLLTALSAGSSGSYSDDYTSLSVYNETALVYRISQQKSSAQPPNVGLYVAILVLYLAIGIPGIYVLVRERKKIRWFRPLVCVLAVGFSALIFVVGSGTRYSRPFLQSLTVLSDENCIENEVTQTVYTGIQAPFNSSYNVSFSPQYSIMPLMENQYWGSTTQNGTVNAKRVATISFDKSQTILSMENLTAFSARYFQLQQTVTGVGKITGSIEKNSDSSGITGTLTNNTAYELVSAIVNIDNELVLIEHWKPGERIELESEQKNGRVHMMTLEQFSDGAYQNRGQWIGQLSSFYEYFLYTKRDQTTVMAQIDYTPTIQKNTDYPVENNTILRLSVTDD